MPPALASSLVVMGVAGSGKSTVAAALAAQAGVDWIEGDDFHSAASRQKMAQGQPLTDADRASWLEALCEQLRLRPGPVVLACSALKVRYRQQLRGAAPALRFAYLDITPADAARRVARRGGHFFTASLVNSQFEALEPPTALEADVLRLDALHAIDTLVQAVVTWAGAPHGVPGPVA